MKNVILKFGGLAILIVLLVVQWKMLDSKSDRIQVLQNNQESLALQVESYRNEKGALVQKSTQLQMTINELKEFNLVSEEKVKEMEVKYKNLQNYVDVVLKSKIDTVLIPKDTVIYRDSTLLIGKKFDFDNYWYRCDGFLSDSCVELNLSCNHNITVASEAIYKGWWIFKKLKKIKSTVFVENPYDTIVKTVIVDVIKK